MAAISTVSKDIFKSFTVSRAEKAFQPWWDTLENYILYFIMMTAILVLQTDVVKGTTMDCTFCQENYCRDANGQTYNNTLEDPKFNWKWIRQECSAPELDPVRYYPYILIVQAILLLVSKRVTLRFFISERKMDKLYEFVTAVFWEEKTDKEFDVDVMNVKNMFRDSCDYYYGYLFQTLSLLTLASGFIFNVYYGEHWSIFHKANHYICTLHLHYYYECHGMPFFLYLCSFYAASVLMILLILLQIINILWLCFPYRNKLFREMRNYKKNLRENLPEERKKKNNKENKKELLGDLYDIYYNGKDLALLLNLLQSSSGIAESLLIMTVLDKKFKESLTPRIESATRTVDDGKAQIILKREASGLKHADLMNVAEISPPGTDNNIQIIEKLPGDKVTVTFTGLKSTEEYKISIFTVINGKKIHKETENIVARDVLDRPSPTVSLNDDKEDKELTMVSFDTQTDTVFFNNVGYNDSD